VVVSLSIALLGVLFNCIANTYDSTGDNPCSKATLPNEEVQNLVMRPLCKKTEMFTKIQPFKACTADSKEFAAQSVQADSPCDDVSARHLWCQRQSRGLGKCFDVLKLDQSDLVVRRATVLRFGVSVAT
jgi:hypothetical protein